MMVLPAQSSWRPVNATLKSAQWCVTSALGLPGVNAVLLVTEVSRKDFEQMVSQIPRELVEASKRAGCATHKAVMWRVK